VSRFARLARAAVVALAAAFAVLVVFSYRKPGARTEGAKDPVAETLLAEANGARDRMRFRDFQYDETRESEGRYRVTASEAVRFDDRGSRLFRLKDVLFESRESKDGRTVSIRAPRAELAEGSRAFRIFDGVEVAGEDMRVTGASFRYDPARRQLASEGPVDATRGGLVANAKTGSVDTRDGVLVLDGDARLRGRGDEGRPVELRAPRVVVGRDGRLEASGGAVLKTDRFVLRGQTFVREAKPGGSHLRATTDARLLVPPERGQPPAVLAASGDVLDLALDAEGRPAAFEASAPGAARLDLAPTETSGARRAEAPRFLGRFEGGRLAELTVPEDLRAAESARAGGAPGSGLRTFAAGFARLTFGPALALETGTFEKNVAAADGTRATIRAPHATLRGRDETAVFAGDPGAPADYRDERGTIRARTLSWSRREERVDAAGDVKTTYAGGGERRVGLLGSDSAAPFFSESDTLRLTGRTSKILLTGSVRAWQNENVLRCGSLELDDREKTLRAEQNVRAFFRREASAPKGRAGKAGKAPAPAGSETVNASSDVLTHREADRFVRLEGHATISSGPWTMNADVTDIRLTETRAIEYAEARGAVVVEDRAEHRRGEGTKAVWRPVTEAVTLEGSPATALDGRGNKSTGAALTFRQGRSQVDVETGGSVPTETVLRPEGS
jgi:lipopolysaccharide export system protein LptA